MGKDHFNLDFLDNLFPNLAFSKSYFHIVPNVASNLLYIVSIVVPYFLHRFKFTLYIVPNLFSIVSNLFHIVPNLVQITPI